jgi:hypothetical protein
MRFLMDEHDFKSIQRRLEESKPRVNAMDGWLIALVVFCLSAARVLYCASAAGPFQACMQSGMPKVIGMALTTAVLIFGIWVGPKIGKRFKSELLGYVSGVTIFLALATALLWLGILQP